MQPFVENEILQILVLAILAACAVSCWPTACAGASSAGSRSPASIIFGIIRIIMWAAPLGAFGGMAYTVAQFGGGSLANLGLLMVTFWGTCALFVFGVLGLVARLERLQHLQVHPDDPRRAADHRRHVVLGDRAAAAAGQAAGPGASKQTVGVVMPTGYSFNLDGTCIYLTLGALFIVQASGQDMAIGEQIALRR